MGSWIRAPFLAGIALGSATDVSPPQTEDRPAQVLPAQISLVELTGADVVLEPGPSDRAGSESANVPKGKVSDIVFSTIDGQIACAALSVGKLLGSDERIVLVPATALRYARIGKRPGFVLRMTTAEIRALPEFDVLKDGKEGLDRAVERARGLMADASGRTGKDSGGGRDRPGGLAPTLAATFTLSSRLGGTEVGASDAVFGKVHDASVDVRTNAIGYLLVSRGDSASVGLTLWIVPLRACRWTGPPGRSVLKLGKTIDQLKSAPAYKPPDQGLITPEQMKAADAFFFGDGQSAGAGSRGSGR